MWRICSYMVLMKIAVKCRVNCIYTLVMHIDFWPRGVVVSALTSHVRGAGFDSRPG